MWESIALPNVAHLTADFFSDILTQNRPFVIRPPETQESKLTKNIRVYFLSENSQDSIILQYIGFLREQASPSDPPNMKTHTHLYKKAPLSRGLPARSAQ